MDTHDPDLLGGAPSRMSRRAAAGVAPENPRLRLSSRSAAVIVAIVVLLALLFWVKEARSTSAPFTSEGELLEQIGAGPADLAANSQSGEDASLDSNEAGEIVVYVSGLVRNPGVYSLPEGSRLIDALELAGGTVEEAELDALNLARIATDGEQIHVDPAGQARVPQVEPGRGAACVDLNTADASGLQELSGIGPALADRIIAYRDSAGPFNTNEDLRNVSGIGPKIYERLHPDLCGD